MTEKRYALDGSLMVPEIRGLTVCDGCRFYGGGTFSCKRPFVPPVAASCSRTGSIYIEDTPEALAAYAVRVLEASNGE